MNINPYLKEKEVVTFDINYQRSKWQKESSVEELSFFSPQLFDMKTSSTPIQGQRLLSYLKDGVMKDNLETVANAKLGLINSRIDGTPLEDVIINKTPRQVKYLLVKNLYLLICILGS